MATAPVRCAIYTRKSTDEGLDRDFNSLDAQREAAESYVASQRHENWVLLQDRYDDGGYTGANTNRPGLQRLLEDVDAGKIDVVVVYKYDRLSRSMLDFLQLLERLKRRGVSFVSVSQRFDTSTPVGEMTLNILLSFAQFERQIIAERTRDKVHAARRRGRWTGGMPILGYDVEAGKLVVNNDEADQVRAIFDLYLELRGLTAVVQELNRRGWRMKSWTTRGGRQRRGSPWNKRSLHPLLRNPLYAGLQRLGDQTFKGDHKAILPKATWEAVQRILDGNRVNGGAEHRNQTGALLRGLLWCSACGRQMIHTWTKGRGGQLHRYYVCTRAQKEGVAACPTRSMPAKKIESMVVAQIRRVGSNPELRRQTFESALAQLAAERRGQKAEVKRLERDFAGAKTDLARHVRALAEAEGPAAAALQDATAAAQERVAAIQARLAGVQEREILADRTVVDEADVGRALGEFSELWSVLATPERERVTRLVLDRVTYSGADVEIKFALPGLAELAEETA
jgi:site-specific DNA recombinase